MGHMLFETRKSVKVRRYSPAVPECWSRRISTEVAETKSDETTY